MRHKEVQSKERELITSECKLTNWAMETNSERVFMSSNNIKKRVL